MSYGLAITVPPDDEPLTLDRAKSHLNVAHDDDDDLITALIQSAREQTEAETGRFWMPRTMTMSLVRFPLPEESGMGFVREWEFVSMPGSIPVIVIPFEPVSAINAVRYWDQSGAQQTLSVGTDYLTWLSHSPPLVYPAPLKFWPLTQLGRLGAVEVEFVTGYSGQVPASAAAAMLIAVAYWYENRGDGDDPAELGLPMGALRLLRTLHTGRYS